MKKHIICLGKSTLDRVWLVNEMPVSAGRYTASDYLELGGGMAANAAVAVAKLGGTAAFWGRGGQDTAGDIMREQLAAYGVDIEYFRLFPGARSSVSAIFVSGDGERMITNFAGDGIPGNADWLPIDTIATANAVHADPRWLEGAVAVYKVARDHGIPTVLDGEVADEPTFAALLPLVDHAIFSEPGLRSFSSDKNIDDRMHLTLALQKARDLGCKVAAVTRGSKGIFWLDDEGAHHQPACDVVVVDTTGAGDVFHGAYALAISEGQTVKQAMAFASAVSALKCTKKGSRVGIPTREETDAFLEEMRYAEPVRDEN